MHRMQPAYPQGINFYMQKWNKKFFKLSPHVENEERRQRGSCFRVSSSEGWGRPSCVLAAGTPWSLKKTRPGPPLQYYGGCLQSEGLVPVQLGCDIWIPFGCISSAHIENYIPQQRDALAILNGRRSIYNDFVGIFKGQ